MPRWTIHTNVDWCDFYFQALLGHLPNVDIDRGTMQALWGIRRLGGLLDCRAIVGGTLYLLFCHALLCDVLHL